MQGGVAGTMEHNKKCGGTILLLEFLSFRILIIQKRITSNI